MATITSRSSIYRNVLLLQGKESFNGISVAKDVEAGRTLSVSTDHFIIGSDPKGSIIHVPMDQLGLQIANVSKVMLGRSSVTEMEHNPFYACVCAISSDDGSLYFGKQIEGQFSLLKTLKAADRRIASINWHPCADFLLAVASSDSTLQIWDIQQSASCLNIPINTPWSLVWSQDGRSIVLTEKDKSMSIVDPRAGAVSWKVGDVFSSTKILRALWLSDETVAVVGFDNKGQKHLKVYDTREQEVPIFEQRLTAGSGAPQMYCDQIHGLLYISARGETGCQIFHWHQGQMLWLSDQKLPSQASNSAFLPKKCVDVSKNEIARIYRSEVDKKLVRPASFLIQRKNEGFNQELYGGILSEEPPLSGSEWLSGENRTRDLLPMQELAADQFSQWPDNEPPDF